VSRAIDSEAAELRQDVRSHVAGQMKVVRKSFVKSFSAKVLDKDPKRLPALYVGSRIPWSGVHERGGVIGGRMLIPLHGRVGRKRFKSQVADLIRGGNAYFIKNANRAKTQLLAFVSINWAVGKVQEIVQVADAWNMMAARLKLATAGQREYTVAQQALFDIAQRIGVPIQETATLYGKLQQAVRMLGGEQQDALAITESISQALRLSGASAAEAQASLLQFGQALASGVLRGEEFNSVVENSPRLAQALPAMLTPGEYVVNRDAVARFGSGFFDALNRLTLPAQAVAQRVQGFASGGLVQPSRTILTRPDLPADSNPVRTVRVELAAGDRKVSASIAERDESSLLQLLQVARARAV
jgi:tape measure domain-containing protein